MNLFLVVLRSFLGVYDAGDIENCERRERSTNDESGSAAPELLTASVVHFFLLIS